MAAVGAYINLVQGLEKPALVHAYTAGRMVVGLFGGPTGLGPMDHTGIELRTPMVWRQRSWGATREALGVGGFGEGTYFSVDVYNDESSNAPWRQGIWMSAYQLMPSGLRLRKQGPDTRVLSDGYTKDRHIYSIVKYPDRDELYDDARNIFGSVALHFGELSAPAASPELEEATAAWEQHWKDLGIPQHYGDFARLAVVDDRRGKAQNRV